MPTVRLRPFEADDLPLFAAQPAEPSGHDFHGFRASNALARHFGENGLISEDHGNLVIEVDGSPVGDVGWFAVHHGPGTTSRALNVGIELFAEHRGRGYGTDAQRLIAEYLFQTTLVERLEASTDAENIGEQRALEKAGFAREGVLRHAQFRGGVWHDCVLYSRLRGDHPIPSPGPATH